MCVFVSLCQHTDDKYFVDEPSVDQMLPDDDEIGLSCHFRIDDNDNGPEIRTNFLVSSPVVE